MLECRLWQRPASRNPNQFHPRYPIRLFISSNYFSIEIWLVDSAFSFFLFLSLREFSSEYLESFFFRIRKQFASRIAEINTVTLLMGGWTIELNYSWKTSPVFPRKTWWVICADSDRATFPDLASQVTFRFATDILMNFLVLSVSPFTNPRHELLVFSSYFSIFPFQFHSF